MKVRISVKSVIMEHPSFVTKVAIYLQNGNPRWNSLDAPENMLYPWDETSTYIKHPPFFQTMVSFVFLTFTARVFSARFERSRACPVRCYFTVSAVRFPLGSPFALPFYL